MLTLGTQRDLTNDMLIKGIIDSVVTVNQFYQMLPFKGIQGNALAYNREMDVDQQGLVNTIRTGVMGINKDEQSFSRHSTELTTIIGDAQVNGLIQAVGSDFHDATAVQVAAKAKGVGRRYMDLLINGQVTGVVSGAVAPTDFAVVLGSVDATWGVARATATGIDAATKDALVSITDFDNVAERKADATIVIASHTGTVSSAKTYKGAFTTGTTEVLTSVGAEVYNAAKNILNGFEGFDGINTLARAVPTLHTTTVTGNDLLARLDEYIDSVHDKDGMVDYMMMNSRGVRKYTTALRATQSAGYDDVMEIKMSSGGVMKVQSYRGVPIFRNDFIGNAAYTAGSTATSGVRGGDLATVAADDIFVGTLDDGSMTHGICGLTALNSSGMQVQKLGAREDYDADITRVKWYCGLAHFSELGLIKGLI